MKKNCSRSTSLIYKENQKDWYKKLAIISANWPTMKVALLRYGTMDKEETRTKLNQIKQELKHRVQVYHDRMEKKIIRGKLKDVEQRL